MKLFVIQCTFTTVEDGEAKETVDGLAICRDPDTPETFIYPNGHPLNAWEIWSFKLHHNMPWAMFKNEEG